MSEQQAEQPVEKVLSDFKGDRLEQVRQKSAFIAKYGFDAFEKVVKNSQPGVNR